MKTKTLLQTTTLTVFILLLTGFFTHAQIPFQGLVANHEGGAAWDADGTGPEPAGYGHIHPFGIGSSCYYAASLDYDDIDPDPDAALAHCLTGINGFPLFEQALVNYGFSPGQVKIKFGLASEKNDIEGEDWFTMGNMHYLNKYDGYLYLELDGEPMISCFIKNYFFTYNNSVPNDWPFESNFTLPFDNSSGSSFEVQEVAEAFMQDMQSEELRIVIEHMSSSGQSITTNGRDGVKFNILSGYLEKGLPELPFTGLEADHEGFACWNADGTGPEPQAYGHTFTWNGINWWMAYYIASRDYDNIDPDPDAALGHFTDAGTGFPNLEIQLAYRGYTIDQLKLKSGYATLGNDIQGIDWWIDSANSIHHYHHYGYNITFEIDGVPIMKYVMDTAFSTWDVGVPNADWESYSSFSTLADISENAPVNAQYVAASFLKDLCGHSIKTYTEGNAATGTINTNGRSGVFHEISEAILKPELPAGTLVWDQEVSDTLFLTGSPYIVMGYIKIPDGETLTIEPGVVVKFNSTERFDIEGCLKAEGTEQLPILFTANDEDVPWGGMVWDQTPPATNPNSVLKYCIFEHSYAYGMEPGYNCGGAVRINQVDSIAISHCIFRYNSADKFTTNNPAGGAIAMFDCSIHISHCIFHDNSSSWGGAIIIGTNSNPVIDNCLFYNNESTFVGGGGGAGLSWDNSSPHFVNCTFADNHSVDDGGGYELEFGGTTTFTNCIFWGNTADIEASQICVMQQNPLPVLNVYYSDVEDGLNGITPGYQGEYLFNIEEYPEFINIGGWFYTLTEDTSPCIDSGTLNPIYLPVDWICPQTCLCGNPRVSNGIIDMGCYEVLQTGKGDFDHKDITSMNIFPNPIHAQVTIEFYVENEMPVEVSVTDIHGRVVYAAEKSALNAGRNQLTFDTGNMAAGVYLCRLKKGNEMLYRKIVKLN
jgi:hypothetical protein